MKSIHLHLHKVGNNRVTPGLNYAPRKSEPSLGDSLDAGCLFTPCEIYKHVPTGRYYLALSFIRWVCWALPVKVQKADCGDTGLTLVSVLFGRRSRPRNRFTPEKSRPDCRD